MPEMPCLDNKYSKQPHFVNNRSNAAIPGPAITCPGWESPQCGDKLLSLLGNKYSCDGIFLLQARSLKVAIPS